MLTILNNTLSTIVNNLFVIISLLINLNIVINVIIIVAITIISHISSLSIALKTMKDRVRSNCIVVGLALKAPNFTLA